MVGKYKSCVVYRCEILVRSSFLLNLTFNNFTFNYVYFHLIRCRIFRGHLLIFVKKEGEQQHSTQRSNSVQIWLFQWLKSNNSKAVALRKSIGLTQSLSEEKYTEIFEKQMKRNITVSTNYTRTQCSYAKYNLTNWNAKEGGDAFMYAVSIMSTVGEELFQTSKYLWGTFDLLMFCPQLNSFKNVEVIFILKMKQVGEYTILQITDWESWHSYTSSLACPSSWRC